MSEESTYKQLSAINVNEHTEKKGRFTYLSWTWAVDQLLKFDPTATWEHRDPIYFGKTVMTFCSVTCKGITRTCQLPVMKVQNKMMKAIDSPDTFDINTTMQRCLVKAIALHGLGLYIYAGEDLPQEDNDPPQPITAARMEEIERLMYECRTAPDLTPIWKGLTEQEQGEFLDKFSIRKGELSQ